MGIARLPKAGEGASREGLLGEPEDRGHRSSRLTRVIDTIHFAPSHHSRLLQTSDLVTFLHRRRTTHTEPDRRAALANEQIWAHVAPIIEHELCWVP